MHIDVSNDTTRLSILQLRGRLDMLSSGQLRQAVQAQIDTGKQQILIDLGEIYFVDSSGLGSLIGCLKAARNVGGDLRIARPDKQVRSLLHLTTLDLTLTPYASVEEAIQSFGKAG